MIEILAIRAIINDLSGEVSRHADIIISSGAEAYRWAVGGLPVEGDLQTILDGREAELWPAAQAAGRPVNLYELLPERVLKALALVMLDEINILRQRAGLALRTAGQIDDAVKAKLKAM